ncbi:HAD-IA family hydrolase [Streptomyces sp. NPDC058576]|uniref:HAD-IA family hydrolase n=1 Tax=Streptomyces sp. NPDC058576 TaxID=3346547 RepID=UPI0036517494
MIIAFDLMDTLVSDPYKSAHEQAFGITYEEFEQRRPEGLYHRLERGEMKEEAYWAALRDVGLSFDTSVFHRTRRSGYTWLEGMRELVAECAGVHRTVIASNYPSWIEEIGRDMLEGTGLEIYASYRFGVRKPSERFFHLLCEKTGVEPRDLVLIDDTRANTDTVIRLGGLGIPFESAVATRQQLRSSGVLSG